MLKAALRHAREAAEDALAWVVTLLIGGRP